MVANTVVPSTEDSELEYKLSFEHQDLEINVRELPPLPRNRHHHHAPPAFYQPLTPQRVCLQQGIRDHLADRTGRQDGTLLLVRLENDKTANQWWI